MNPYLTIVIPVYNGGEELGENIETVLSYLDERSFDGEVVVVNDGSTDGTARALSAISDERLRVLTNEQNRGKGFSVRRGILEGTGDLRVFFDADLTYPVEQVDLLISELEGGSDIVIGSRVEKRSKFIIHCYDLRYIFRRHLLSRVFNLFLHLTLLKGLKDTQSGFKGFKGTVAEDIFSKQRSRDFSFDLELLFIAQKAGYKIKEIPVTLDYKGTMSTVDMFKDSFAMFERIIKTWVHYLRGHYR